MAIIKAFTLENFVSGDYLKTYTIINTSDNSGQACVNGYVSQQAYDAGAQPIADFEIPLAQSTMIDDDTGVLTRMSLSAVNGKTESEIDMEFKKGKIEFGSIVVDLTI